MKPVSQPQPVPFPFLAWLIVALAGVVAPAVALLMVVQAPATVPLALVLAPILAVGVMGVAMIAAAVAGRLWIGVLLALLTGAGLLMLARALGLPTLPHTASTSFAMIVASFSFAARGKLFARSAADRGWWIAVFVVGGEAAMLVTAATMPGALPDWLLVLLPAQWASMAIHASLTGAGIWAASSPLLALAGTAAATLVVARLWPRRWPYALMFTAWLGLSALVWYRPAPPMPHADVPTGSAATVESSQPGLAIP